MECNLATLLFFCVIKHCSRIQQIILLSLTFAGYIPEQYSCFLSGLDGWFFGGHVVLPFLSKPWFDCGHSARAMNGEAVHACPRKTGMIIFGGGLPKHHLCNANMMRNGTDYAVFINTPQEFDGSDSGARPDEAV